uniref:serpin-ZX-like n=1 Tax=Erigeron canadensis TaxID=72917 RepID=UPI001CB9048E|nr:serpin-ZX-like [Erigeron canadensis]
MVRSKSIFINLQGKHIWFLFSFLFLCFSASAISVIDNMQIATSDRKLIIASKSTVEASSDGFIKQSISNQTQVSITLADHIFSKTSPRSNVVFSPLSIQTVLGLVASGSDGETLNQLLSFLKVNTFDELNALSSRLVSSIMADGSSSGGPRLSFVSGVWADQTISLKDSFKHVLETVYKAASKRVDFVNKTEEVLKEVNLWAREKTDGLIKEILRPGILANETVIMLANALYFKGVWKEKFDRLLTRKTDFHLLDGRKVQVPFMTTMKKQLVGEYDGFKVMGLPYVHGEDKRRFSMYIYLPDEKDGLPSLIRKISSEADFLESHIPHKKVQVGEVLIPKFKISSEFGVSDMLKELGVELPFKGGAITEMEEDENVHVANIQHQSVVEVDEEGSEAAATTLTLLKNALRTTVDFVADHPFLFTIREDTSGAVLFMGQVIDPSVS